MLNVKKGSKVLLLAPHTDDVEITCGGTVAMLARLGCELKYIAFSDCKESIPDGLPLDTLAQECIKATAKLGLQPDQIEILDFPVRHFTTYRQDILEHLIKVRSEFQPNAVICPSEFDVHQDHKTIADETVRAFRNSTILGYEAPWNNISARHDLYVELNDEDLIAKSDAIKCYRSQKFRSYSSDEYLKSLARVRGQQAGYEFAEAFSITRIRIDKE
jgi:LmbE family N-acetylglucosaminyl deacetylase